MRPTPGAGPGILAVPRHTHPLAQRNLMLLHYLLTVPCLSRDVNLAALESSRHCLDVRQESIILRRDFTNSMRHGSMVVQVALIRRKVSRHRCCMD